MLIVEQWGANECRIKQCGIVSAGRELHSSRHQLGGGHQFGRGDQLFNAGDEADAGYIVQRGAFRIEDGGAEIIAGPGALIGELALIVAMKRPSSAVAIEQSTVIRVARSLFQRVLESDPAAARRLRDELASRTSQLASDILMAGAKLSI